MSYKIRNTLVLATFIVLIVLVGGYLTVFSYPGKIEETSGRIKKVEAQIEPLRGIEAKYFALDSLIKSRERALSSLDKRISREVTPANTYQYLNSILARTGFLEFSMLYSGKKTSQSFAYNTYRLKGEAPFNRLFQFLWYLERGPEIYQIKKLTLHGVESKDPETQMPELVVPFEMEISSYYSDIADLPPIKRSLDDVVVPPAINPFYPHVLRNLPPNSDNLVEVERAELKAVLQDQALVADHNGRVHVLRKGSRVYLGYLNRIDPEKNQVEFTLNKGGIVEKVLLRMRFEGLNE